MRCSAEAVAARRKAGERFRSRPGQVRRRSGAGSEGRDVDRRELAEVLAAVEAGALSADEAAARLARAPFEDLGYAKPDLARGMRQGVGEVVYGEGKTASQIEGICRALAEGGQPRVLVTRVDEAKAASLAAALPAFAYRPKARARHRRRPARSAGRGPHRRGGGGDERRARGRRGGGDGGVLGKRRRALLRRGRGRHPSPVRLRRRVGAGPRGRRRGGHGGSLAERCGGAGGVPGRRRAHERGLRGVVRRGHGASGHAELVRERRVGGQRRQRLRRRLPGEPDQPSGHLPD